MLHKLFRRLRQSKPIELDDVLAAIDQRMPKYLPRPDWSKEAFLKGLPPSSRILDVGCGNNSPYLTKQLLPNCHYVGLDVGNYNQREPNLADEYLLATPQSFADEIAKLPTSFDAVISAHNLEHCDDRHGVLSAMLNAVRPGGMLYLSFPSADTVSYPKRDGTLNYFDDATHKGTPPKFGEVISTIAAHSFDIVYASSRYQPPIRWLIGLFYEEDAAVQAKILNETWAFWGFESLIWARKRA